MRDKTSFWRTIAISVVIIAVVVVLIVFAPSIRGTVNDWEHDIQKVDDVTNYETRKKVEDTCRAYIASYQADKVTYETLQGETDDVSIETARAAKIRANRTAATYNEYYLKNSYVWRDNIPNDIFTRLEIIE